jgi:hypothetical protein
MASLANIHHYTRFSSFVKLFFRFLSGCDCFVKLLQFSPLFAIIFAAEQTRKEGLF